MLTINFVILILSFRCTYIWHIYVCVYTYTYVSKFTRLLEAYSFYICDTPTLDQGMTEDEMVGWHHQLNGHEFEQGPGVGDGQGGLACCSPSGCKESDTTERLN